MARVDYTDRAEAYRRARTPPAEVLAVWRAALDGRGRARPRRVVDVGAGPGAFLGPLAEWFDAPVVAVEPSLDMRQAARAAGSTEHHRYVAAWAEALPLAEGSVDLAWLSTVVHHFDDRDAAARELRRVLGPGGRVLVRGFLADVAITGLLTAFPGIERAARSFPSTDDVVASFARASFAVEQIVDVVEPWRFAAQDWVDRVRGVRDTDSLLRHLTDAEVAEGVRVVTMRHRDRPGPIGSEVTLRLIEFGTGT